SARPGIGPGGPGSGTGAGPGAAAAVGAAVAGPASRGSHRPERCGTAAPGKSRRRGSGPRSGDVEGQDSSGGKGAQGNRQPDQTDSKADAPTEGNGREKRQTPLRPSAAQGERPGDDETVHRRGAEDPDDQTVRYFQGQGDVRRKHPDRPYQRQAQAQH